MSRAFLLRRLMLVYGVFLAVVLGRLVQLQVLEHEAWQAEAVRARSSGRTLPFTRGRILDRRGEVLAEDRSSFVLRWEYRDFRRNHFAGMVYEAAQLAGLPVAGLEDAWRRAEPLTAKLLRIPAEELQALPASRSGDLQFYLQRLSGLPRERSVELQKWAEKGSGPFLTWPEGPEGFRERLARDRRAWARLEALFPGGELLPQLEEERRRLELRIRLLGVREAAASARGMSRRQVLRLLTEDEELAGEVLRELARRWDLADDAETLDWLRRCATRTRPPSGEEEEWARNAGMILRHVEERVPEDLEGVRRKLVREVHGNWRPVLARDLDWALVDLVSQDPDRFPGLEAEEEHVRRYAGAVDPHLLGYLREPQESELASYEQLSNARRELRRMVERSDEEQLELEMLERRLTREVRRPDDAVPVQGAEWVGEDVLQGQRGLLRRLRWDEEEPLELEFLPPVNGGDLRLAVDEAWTRAAIEAIEEGYETAVQALPSKPGGAAILARMRARLERPQAGFVLLDLRDGTVPVAVTAPSYDAERFRQDYETLAADPARPLRHRALGSAASAPQIPYPGSTFKLVAALEALEQDLGWWERTFVCERVYLPPYAPQTRLSCTGHHGELDLRVAIRESCNIYFYHLAEELGFDAIHDRAQALGFGDRTTGLDLSSFRREDGSLAPAGGWLEVGGRLHPPDGRGKGRTVNAMRLSIGQTYVEASPLQMARFYGWLATGKLWRPRMVLERDGAPTEAEWGGPPLDPRVRELLHEALLDVTGPEGTAHDNVFGDRQLDVYGVAGKTGTAQTGRSRSGREFPTHAWFVGFFPAARAGEPPVEPRYAVAVLCENTDLHGGWIANYVLHAFLRRVEGELLR